MGNPLEPPTLIDDKYYCITVQRYTYKPDVTGCEGFLSIVESACVLGLHYNVWLAAGNMCKWGGGLISPWYLRAEGVLSVTGPYATPAECVGAC